MKRYSYIGTLPLYYALPKAAKRYAGINEKNGPHLSEESVCGEAGFEVYCRGGGKARSWTA